MTFPLRSTALAMAGGAARAAEDVPWEDIPAVQLIGGVIGTVLLIAAIRSMFGRKG